MKRLAVVLVATALAFATAEVALASGGTEKQGSAKSYTIGYSQFWGTNPFLIAMTNGANKAIEEWKAKGVNVKMIVTNGGDTDASKQVSDTEDLFSQKVDGLLIFPGDSTLLSEPVKNIYNKNNIPVVVTDIGLTSGEYASFLITDNYLGGKQLADLVAKNVAKGAKVVTFQHGPGNNNALQRQAGFEDRAKELGLTVLPAKKLKLSLEEGKTTMEDTLASDPDIAAAFMINQVVAQGAVSALEAAGNARCKVVTFDIDKPSLDMVKNGKILGITVQDPWLIGREGMNQILTVLTGGTAKKTINVPPKLCTKENASEFDNDPQVSGK